MAIDLFGIREVCDITCTSLKGGPAFEIKSATMSSLEVAATTVYAQGGKGNARLLAWDGDKNVTFKFDSAIIDPTTLNALFGDQNSIKANKFPGYYQITATSLVRDLEKGEDYPITITIHRAKLSPNFTISMSPTGEPTVFSFVFDAFPKSLEDKEIASIIIADSPVSSSAISTSVFTDDSHAHFSIFINENNTTNEVIFAMNKEGSTWENWLINFNYSKKNRVFEEQTADSGIEYITMDSYIIHPTMGDSNSYVAPEDFIVPDGKYFCF